MLAGCMTTETSNKNVSALFSQWAQENERQNQALGERVYDKDFDVVFSAVVTSFSDIGFAVKNMERQSGYILAEGPNPVPESQLRPLAQRMCDELNKVSSTKWVPRLGNETKSATITVVRLGDHKTKLKMRIANTEIRAAANATRHYQTYPPSLEAEYQSMWRALEKQIFLDENLDNLKK
jgi:hypothetical protein